MDIKLLKATLIEYAPVKVLADFLKKYNTICKGCTESTCEKCSKFRLR